jgi:hypothetical protein
MTSLPSHDKSLPRTTSPDWCVGPDPRREHRHSAHGGTNLHIIQVQQLAAMQAARPTKSLNAGLTS